MYVWIRPVYNCVGVSVLPSKLFHPCIQADADKPYISAKFTWQQNCQPVLRFRSRPRKRLGSGLDGVAPREPVGIGNGIIRAGGGDVLIAERLHDTNPYQLGCP